MRARSGPTPITSTRAPGKRSSASPTVETPLSPISGATNRPPERCSLMRNAPATVFDFRHALGLRRRFGVEDLDPYLAAAGPPPRSLDFPLLSAPPPHAPG